MLFGTFNVQIPAFTIWAVVTTGKTKSSFSLGLRLAIYLPYFEHVLSLLPPEWWHHNVNHRNGGQRRGKVVRVSSSNLFPFVLVANWILRLESVLVRCHRSMHTRSWRKWEKMECSCRWQSRQNLSRQIDIVVAPSLWHTRTSTSYNTSL